MTAVHPCRPTATIHPLRQRGDFAPRKDEHAMNRTHYVAELLGVLPEPLPLELAHLLADILAIGVDAIGTGPMLDSSGARCWGVFRVHMTFRDRVRAELAALGLARELGDAARACILSDWQEPADARPNTLAQAAGARRAGGAV